MSTFRDTILKASLRFVRTGLVVALFLQTVACSHQNFTRSGFLNDYDSLKKSAENEKIETYVKNDNDWSGYGTVVVDPVLYYPPPEDKAKLSPEEERRITSLFHESFTTTLIKNGFTVVAEPQQNGVLRVRSAITGVDTSNPFLNVVSTLALYLPVDNGGASAEIEVLDARTSERLAAFVLYDNGKPWQLLGYFKKFGHAEASFDKWSGYVSSVITPKEPRMKMQVGNASYPATASMTDPGKTGL